MTADAFDLAYESLARLVAAEPTLMRFAGWPPATPGPRPAVPVPAARMLHRWRSGHSPATEALQRAVCDIALLAHWQQTYTEDEVGADFLARYGWFELVGPGGHFRSDRIRAFIAYWAEGLRYPWHLHEAEEIYYVIAGRALFEAEGEAPAMLGPGDTRFHASNQPHAMTTTDSPVLALVLWRGAGLTDRARIGRT